MIGLKVGNMQGVGQIECKIQKQANKKKWLSHRQGVSLIECKILKTRQRIEIIVLQWW